MSIETDYKHYIPISCSSLNPLSPSKKSSLDVHIRIFDMSSSLNTVFNTTLDVYLMQCKTQTQEFAEMQMLKHICKYDKGCAQKSGLCELAMG